MKTKNLAMLAITITLIAAFAGCGKEQPATSDPLVVSGPPGKDGTSCTVADNGDGTATISCTDGTSVTIHNGTDGTSCTVRDNGDGTKTITCPDGTSVTVSDGQGCTITPVFQNGEPCNLIECGTGTSTVTCVGPDCRVEEATQVGTATSAVVTCVNQVCGQSSEPVFCSFDFGHGRVTSGLAGDPGSTCDEQGNCRGGATCDSSGVVPYCEPASPPDAGFVPDATVPDSGNLPEAGMPDSGRPQGCVPPNDRHGDPFCECIQQRYCREPSLICLDSEDPDVKVCIPRDQYDAGVAPDATTPPDSGDADGGVTDSGIHLDAQPVDTGIPPDSGVQPDTGIIPDSGINPDAQPVDTGIAPDTGIIPDSGIHQDATTPDASEVPDSGPISFSDGGVVTPPSTMPVYLRWTITSTQVPALPPSVDNLRINAWCDQAVPQVVYGFTYGRVSVSEVMTAGSFTFRVPADPVLGTSCRWGVTTWHGEVQVSYWIPGYGQGTQIVSIGMPSVEHRVTGEVSSAAAVSNVQNNGADFYRLFP